MKGQQDGNLTYRHSQQCLLILSVIMCAIIVLSLGWVYYLITTESDQIRIEFNLVNEWAKNVGIRDGDIIKVTNKATCSSDVYVVFLTPDIQKLRNIKDIDTFGANVRDGLSYPLAFIENNGHITWEKVKSVCPLVREDVQESGTVCIREKYGTPCSEK